MNEEQANRIIAIAESLARSIERWSNPPVKPPQPSLVGESYEKPRQTSKSVYGPHDHGLGSN